MTRKYSSGTFKHTECRPVSAGLSLSSFCIFNVIRSFLVGVTNCGNRSFVGVTSCGYRAYTVASCAKGWTDIYCMWYRAYTSELFRQLSSVDLTRIVYKTPHVTLRYLGFNQITSLDTLIVIVEMRLALLLWERVYPAVAPLMSETKFRTHTEPQAKL
jgi:hypothetical protein